MRCIISRCLVCLAALTLVAATPPQLDRAVRAQEELVIANPHDARAFNDLGNLRLLAGDRDGARTAYERAVELDPALVSAHFNLGLLWQEHGELERAAERYRRVLELVPEHAWAHFQLGMVAEQRDRERRAVRHYVNAFRLDPRLTFDDVNPQIIDSELVTAALLLLEEERAGSRQAPRSYEESQRIAALLLPAAPETEVTETEPGREAESETLPSAADATRRPVVPRELEAEARSVSGEDGAAERDPALDQPEATAEERPQDSASAGSRRLTAEDLESGSSVGEVTPLSARSQTRRSPSRDLQERLRERYRQAREGTYPSGTASTGRIGTQVEPDRQ